MFKIKLNEQFAIIFKYGPDHSIISKSIAVLQKILVIFMESTLENFSSNTWTADQFYKFGVML